MSKHHLPAKISGKLPSHVSGQIRASAAKRRLKGRNAARYINSTINLVEKRDNAKDAKDSNSKQDAIARRIKKHHGKHS